MEQEKDLLETCLSATESYNVSFAEARIFEKLIDRIHLTSGKIETTGTIFENGLSVRIILDGAWGYATSARAEKKEIAGLVKHAADIAQANRRKLRKPVELTEEPVISDSYVAPCKKDPFEVDFEEKLEVIGGADSVMRDAGDQIKVSTSWLDSFRIKLFFANSEGTRIFQQQTFMECLLRATAVGDEVQNRSFNDSQMKGFELAQELDLEREAARVAEEALLLVNEAKNCPKRIVPSFILEPYQLGLTIHESTGHPTELDRVMGFEADLAGTSFLTLDKYGTDYKYGSELVNIVCDPTLPFGLGSIRYDDEGVQAKKFHVIKRGIFKNYLTDRELAHEIGYEHSFGNARIANYNRLPLVRMGNLHLESDPQGPKDIEELIVETKEGVFALSWKSHSIDDKRVNFQFSTELGWLIKGGELTKPLKNVCYNASTPEFWGSCDMITKTSRIYGMGPSCGKGIPIQGMWISHGGGHARFQNVSVFAG